MVALSNYYTKHKRRYLAEFDLMVRFARPVLVRYFGEQQLQQLISETRQDFQNIIPRLPYIGGKQPFTEFIVLTGMQLALYRIASAHGKDLAKTAGLAFEIGQEVVGKAPPFLLELFAPMNFSSRYLERARQRATESHRSEYPEDYVYDFVEGDGETFDYGIDYVQCASCKFLAREGAFELAPYLCPSDILYSEAFGWGLARTQTLAQGHSRCDFRFKRGGPTKVAVPEAISSLVAGKTGNIMS